MYRIATEFINPRDGKTWGRRDYAASRYKLDAVNSVARLEDDDGQALMVPISSSEGHCQLIIVYKDGAVLEYMRMVDGAAQTFRGPVVDRS